MPKNEGALPLLHAVFCSVLTALFVSAGPFVPLLGFWGLLLCPLPLAFLGCRDGAGWLGAGLLLTWVALSFGVSQALALYFLAGCAPLSLALFLVAEKPGSGRTAAGRFALRKNRPGKEALLICALAALGAKVALLGIFWVLTGDNILVPDMGQVEKFMIQMVRGLEGKEVAAVQEAIGQIALLIPRMTPSLVMIYAGLEATVNYALCALLARKAPPARGSSLEARTLPPLPPLSRWRFPRSLLPVFFLSVLLSYFLGSGDWPEGALFAMNLRLVLNVLFFAQGFSMALWWLRRFRPLVRGAVAVLLLFPLLWPWLLFLGVMDMGFDLRARAGKRAEGRQE